MKIYLGPYKNWIGPYQIADKIPFLNEDQRHEVGGWLADNTPLMRICTWIDSKRKRKVHIRIDKYDTWNMDSTLSPIILPMLKQLKETKHGSPIVDDEDLPTTMRYSTPDKNGVDPWVHHKWDWVLNEMIWAFEHLADDTWEEQFYHGTPEYSEEEEVEIENYGKCYSIKQTNPDYWVDWAKINEYNERINNGCRLFGKYYRNLWD